MKKLLIIVIAIILTSCADEFKGLSKCENNLGLPKACKCKDGSTVGYSTTACGNSGVDYYLCDYQ